MIMTPEKELRYRPYEDTQKAKELEMTMNSQWEVLAAKVRIKTNQERIRQEQKNEEAFRLLFPGVKASLDILIRHWCRWPHVRSDLASNSGLKHRRII